MSSIELGSILLDTLVGGGVTDLVLAPGSRSAAIALAAHRAAQENRIRLHVRIDERVAGFTALGLAKSSGRTVAVVTTSGTAVANLSPAAMEATASGVPLLLITADRPAYLVGSGANQTGDQVGVFGTAARAVIRVAADSGPPHAWVAAIRRALAIASGSRTRQPGAVQLNAEFDTPIVDSLPPATEQPWHLDASRGSDLIELDSRRTVILAGDATPEIGAEARALAEISGAPLLAEPSSNARAGHSVVPRYQNALVELLPEIERVICFGHPTLSRPVNALLSAEHIELVVVSTTANWYDPGLRAARVADRVVLAEQTPAWLAKWQSLDADEGHVGFGHRDVVEAVQVSVATDEDLMLGASSIIRAANEAAICATRPKVYANRGLAGIDGTISTAVGIGLASGRKVTVLLGDLTTQHDLGALVRPPLEAWPQIRIVVADDDGGSIFQGLEQGAPEYADSFDRVFRTPQSLRLVAVAAALGWNATEVSTRAELTEALHSEADFIVAKLDPPPRG